ncbi:sensor histidine kinase [Paenibacillus harenae]|uniref:sensor histidine kinase n=1 Tax=Paenibacillus harenae TaxID=306543 RepID=UPI00040E34D3|nr:histidine kinase [Paenibacillus harenae]
MNQSITYVPFSYKIMIPYLLLIILTEIIIGSYTYTRLSNSSKVLTEINMKMTFQQITDNIGYQFHEAQQISDSLFQSTEIQRYLALEASPFEIYRITRDHLLPLLAAPLQLARNNIRIMLYVKNERFKEVFKDPNVGIQEKSSNLLYYSRIENEDWFKQLTLQKLDNQWMQVDTDLNQNNLSLIRKLIWFNDYQTEIGYLRISLPLEELFQSLDNVRIGEQSIIVQVRDKTEDVIVYQVVSDGEQRIQAEESYFTVKHDIQGTGYGLEILVPDQYFLKDARNIRNVTLFVCVSSFLIMLIIGIFVARLSNRKMRKIISYVRSLRSGEFRKRIQITGQDEFAQIAVAFNQTASDIDNLISTVYLQKINVKEAELKALQAQINPHFLYNTLSSINSLANMGETGKVSSMVTGLAKFYRLTLNDGRTMIPLVNELEQVRSYIDIQKIKYANRFDTWIEVDPLLLECEVTKLILQPFVENALKYAWHVERLTVKIVGRRMGERIFLSIIDNGIGIHRSRLHKINTDQLPDSGHGISNVNHRIRLRYGEDYGVTISSFYGGGTTALLVLPYDQSKSSQIDLTTMRGEEA